MIDAYLALVPLALVLGALIGSFLNVVIYRVPRGMSVSKPRRSFCPRCSRQVAWHENVPVLSWILLNGRCRGCGGAIGAVYPLVEAATAILFAACAWLRLEEVGATTLAALPPLVPLRIAVDVLAVALLVAIAVIDFRHAIIPDPLTIPWLPLVLAAVAIDPHLLRGHALDPSLHPDRALVAAVLAGAFLGAYPALFFDFAARRREEHAADAPAPSALPTPDEVYDPWDELRSFVRPVLLPAAAGAVLLPLAFANVHAGPHVGALLAAGAGAGAGLLLIFVLRLAFSLAFGREAMGLGDAKFLALAGALFGAEGALAVFLVGSLLGALPAFASLFRRLPLATGLLLGAALLPLVLTPILARAGVGPAAGALLLPLPLIALLLFLRRLRRTPLDLQAMPFGPFLVLATLLLVLALPQLSTLPLLRSLFGGG